MMTAPSIWTWRMWAVCSLCCYPGAELQWCTRFASGTTTCGRGRARSTSRSGKSLSGRRLSWWTCTITRESFGTATRTCLPFPGRPKTNSNNKNPSLNNSSRSCWAKGKEKAILIEFYFVANIFVISCLVLVPRGWHDPLVYGGGGSWCNKLVQQKKRGGSVDKERKLNYRRSWRVIHLSHRPGWSRKGDYPNKWCGDPCECTIGWRQIGCWGGRCE